MKKLKPAIQKQFDILASAMDARDKVFKLVKEFEDKEGFVPAQYHEDVKFMSNYVAYKVGGAWRTDKTAMAVLISTAKLIVKNQKKKK